MENVDMICKLSEVKNKTKTFNKGFQRALQQCQ